MHSNNYVAHHERFPSFRLMTALHLIQRQVSQLLNPARQASFHIYATIMRSDRSYVFLYRIYGFSPLPAFG